MLILPSMGKKQSKKHRQSDGVFFYELSKVCD